MRKAETYIQHQGPDKLIKKYSVLIKTCKINK